MAVLGRDGCVTNDGRRRCAALRAGLAIGLLVAVFATLACSRKQGAEAGGATPVPAVAEGDLVLEAPPPAPVVQLPACQGDRFQVDLLKAVGALPGGPEEAQKEQLRDWVWQVVLARASRGSSVENVFGATVDEPVFRDDSLAHALRLPTGPTRATLTKDGELLVLADASAKAWRGSLFDAIDEQALALGRTPERVRVYAFALSSATATAEVCQVESLDTAAIESAENGFVRANVTSAAQLQAFFDEGVDLVAAECKATGLEVSGRKRPRSAGARMLAEHVAALGQKLQERYIPPSRFGKSAETEPAEVRASLLERTKFLEESFARAPADEWRRAIGSPSDEGSRLFLRLLSWREANPGVRTIDLLLSAELQAQFDGKPGFSLDPQYTRKNVLARVDEILAVLPDPKAFEGLLQLWGLSEGEIALYRVPASVLLQEKAALEGARKELAATAEDLLQAKLGELRNRFGSEHAIAANLMVDTGAKSGIQCARYDGPLAGTEAGMTFFYTDASAKFFARDFDRRSPEGVVSGFESVVNHVGSTAWCDEAPRPSTRIWFGLRNEGYTREPGGGLRFGPTATRLFAKGSALGGGADAETEPNATYRRFIRWWDEHYGSISEWDPQYEVLNQLMKWSVLTHQARLSGKEQCLGFLRGVPVRTDLRLASWSGGHPDLRWRDALARFRASPSGVECLPVIRSDPFSSCGGITTLVGGVSAGTITEVRAKPPRKSGSNPWLSRLAVDTEPAATGPGSVRFTKIERSGGKLTEVEIAGRGKRIAFRANLERGAGQVGRHIVFDPRAPVRSIEKTVEQVGDAVRITQLENAETRFGLTAYDLSLAAVKLDVVPGARQRAQAVAERVASKMARDDVALASAATAVVDPGRLLLLDNGDVAVRYDEGPKTFYAVMASGGGKRGPPPGADVAILVGPPDGGRLPPRGPPVPYAPPLKVSVLSARDGESYVAAHRGVPARSRRPDTTADRALLDAALSERRYADADAVLKKMLPSMDEGALLDLQTALAERGAAEARSGSSAPVDRLRMAVAVAARRATPPDARDLQLSGSTVARILTPPNYPLEAGLPPPIHPRGTPLPPSKRFVSRAFEIPEGAPLRGKLSLPSGELRIGSSPSASRSARAAGAGRNARLLQPTLPAAVVVECSDDPADTGEKPRCTERAPAAEVQVTERLLQMVCPAPDGPGSADPACLKEAEACDLDHDGSLLADAEQACLRQVARKYAVPASTSRL